MGNNQSIVRYRRKDKYMFVEGDQIKDISTNKNFIYFHFLIQTPTKNEREKFGISKYTIWRYIMKSVFVVLRDHNNKIFKEHVISNNRSYYSEDINCYIKRKYIRNEYELACKKKSFNIDDIKNYPNQRFLEIDGIYDIGDAVYSRLKHKFGIVTDILENGRVKVALIYDLPKTCNIKYATVLKDE